MIVLMPALLFAVIGLSLLGGIAAMFHAHIDKIRAAWDGDSLVSRGVGDQVVVNVRWKSRGEARRSLVLATRELGWRAAA